jgi:GNAT superfamily N-acetyltransferase
MSEADANLARGMYGDVVPVRPAPRGVGPSVCLNGHDLAVAGAGSGYSHRYRLAQEFCNVCYTLDAPRSSWCLVNPGDQHLEAVAPTTGLVLVRIPPAERGGVGQLRLHVNGTARADLDLAVCGPCRRAVLEQIRVDEDHTRLGYGWVLVAAALAMASPSNYRWSTTRIDDSAAVRAFWSRVGFPGALGEPIYCTDMERAAGRLPDW